jgi:NAD(P)-dependent dehydrogenase (short-subunit alcohol dehydrogenase family)
VTVEDQVEQLFDAVQRELGAPSIAIHNVGAYLRKSILESTKDDLEMCWRLCCLGGFLVGRAAARIMVPRGRGTILFTGATSSLRGAALFHNNAVAKFGVRAISQSMARELQPRGVHVAHVVIDGAIESEHLRSILDKRDPNTFLPPDDIAEAYYQLHRQHRGAWTQEIDLRSWKEGFKDGRPSGSSRPRPDVARPSISSARQLPQRRSAFARRALDEALEHAHGRRMFGGMLWDLQLTQAAFGDMATEADAAALLTYRAAWRRDVQKPRRRGRQRWRHARTEFSPIPYRFFIFSQNTTRQSFGHRAS